MLKKLLFSHGLLATLLCCGVALSAGGNDNRRKSATIARTTNSGVLPDRGFPHDLLVPEVADLPLTFDQAYRLAHMDNPLRTWGLLLPPRAPVLQRELLLALRDANPEKAAKAAQILGLTANFAVIEPLLEFARASKRDDEGICAAMESVLFLLDAQAGEDRSPAVWPQGSEPQRTFYLRLCNHFETEATEWKHTTFVEFHARRVERLVRRIGPRQSDDYRALLFESLTRLMETDDAEHAAPLLIDWATRIAREGHDYEMTTLILYRLQTYVGPIDVPEADKLEVDKALQAINEWWRANRRTKPANWVLDRLASKGYTTRVPANIATTGTALALAIRRGSPAERYAAEAFLAWTLPDGGSLCVPDLMSKEWYTQMKKSTEGPLRDFLHSTALTRVLRWSVIDGMAMKWSATDAKYEISSSPHGPEGVGGKEAGAGTQ